METGFFHLHIEIETEDRKLYRGLVYMHNYHTNTKKSAQMKL